MKKRLISLLLALCLTMTLAPWALAADEEQNSDYVAFYLTQYEMQSGDTMSSVCSKRGINFANYKTIIQNVNKISNFNYLIAGRKYWIPANAPGAAENYYTVYRHTLVSGDTVNALCSTYGISLSENETIIKQLNGNPSNLSSFYVGTPIYIPVYTSKTGSTTDSTTGTTTGGTTADGTTAGSTTTGGTTTDNTTGGTTDGGTTNQNSDYVAFYLTRYEMQSGDTMSSVCSQRGISFASYQTILKSVNNISNFNYLIAGRKYWIPAATPGAAENFYTVYRHMLVPGDTVYALCITYGISLSESQDMILKLNNAKTLNSFKANTPIYIPVFTEKAAGSGSTGSGIPTNPSGTTTTTTVTNPDGTTTTTTTTTTITESANLFDATTAAKYGLVPYTVKSGDSLVGICNGLGTSYSKNAELIASINSMANLNNVTVGTTLWVPVSPTYNWTTEHYMVTKHVMAAGETVYGICKASNVDFSSSYKFLSTLNPGKNFNWLKVGDVIWIPAYNKSF